MGLRGAVRTFSILTPLTTVVRDINNSSQLPLSCDDTRAHIGGRLLAVYTTPGSSVPFYLDAPACRRLISRTFLPDQVIDLIEAVFTKQDEVKAIGYLCGDDAQNFIDVIHEVNFHTPSFPRQAG